MPECTTATVTTLGMQQVVTEQTIDYTYDPLNRLTGASYDDGSSFVYTYDAVGNRLTDTVGDVTNQYVYDAANRLASVNGQDYTWDNNGNLLSDGVQNYTYNYANRLTQVVKGSDTYQYQYNGLGDRLQSILNGTATTYSLDLNSGLTQVLADGTNTYTSGYNRIAQVSDTQTGYFLGDALGSVRQVVDPQAEILLAQSYSLYGMELSKVGDFATAFTYTGEMTDGTGLVHLRARYYDPGTGRFVSRDTWEGNYNDPITLNKWLYANGNPIIHTDPSGYSPYVDCSKIILPDLRSLCETSNGYDYDDETIDARWKFFYHLADYSMLFSLINGTKGEGYYYAGLNFKFFLDKRTKINLTLPQNTSFSSDAGIMRATKIKTPKIAGDEPESIRPLLYFFLQDYMQPSIQDCSVDAPPLSYTVFSNQTYRGINSPRPHDKGWWAAFGHVNIDATYSNVSFITQTDGYYITTQVNYTILDRYEWFLGKSTPLSPPVTTSPIFIPHAWELSLVQASKANMFDFTVTWSEKLQIFMPFDFSGFRIERDNLSVIF